MLRISLLTAGLLTLATAAVAQRAHDTLTADMRNLRGFNYLAIYPSLYQPGQTIPNSPNSIVFNDVASPSAMWELYDPATTANEVDQQLGLLKDIGVNTVRVFMSFPSWQHYESLSPTNNQYNARFLDFLDKCHDNGIRCVPVIWDNTGAGSANPPGSTYYSNALFHSWHSNPGEPTLRSWLGPATSTLQSFANTPADTYIRDLMAVANNHPGFLMWDVFNEGALAPDLITRSIEATLAILGTSSNVLVGLPWHDPQFLNFANDNRVDVVAVHSYMLTSSQNALRSMVYNASHTPTANGKIVIATEIGSSGYGYSYKDAVHHCQNVRRDDLGANETGVGFMCFSSNIGWFGSINVGGQVGYPFKNQSGVFFGTINNQVTVRDPAVLRSFEAAAAADAIKYGVNQAPPGLPNAVQIQSSQPEFVPQGLFTFSTDDYGDRTAFVTLPPTQFALFSNFGQYIELRLLATQILDPIRNASELAILPNGNPFGGNPSTPPPANSLVSDLQYGDYLNLIADTEVLAPGGGFLSTPLTQQIVANSGGQGPFDPINNPLHCAWLSFLTFPQFQPILAPFVLNNR